MSPFQNHLLARLSRVDQAALALELTPLVLNPGEVLQQQDEERQYAYFPEGGLIALKRVLPDGLAAGAAMVGREGMVGSPLGASWRRSPDRATVQMIGTGNRLLGRRLSELAVTNPALGASMAYYAEWIAEEARQTAICNALHTIGHRLATWLLLCSDRVHKTRLDLTHEFMSDMLGVQRSSITLALRSLSDAGLITTGRSWVEIVDRAGLETLCCICYLPIGRDLAAAVGCDPRTAHPAAG